MLCYRQQDIYLSLPVINGKESVEKIFDFKLTDTEQVSFNETTDTVWTM